jgi:hypothetical protein
MSVKQLNAIDCGGAKNFIDECKSGTFSPSQSPASPSSTRKLKRMAAAIREKNKKEAEDKKEVKAYSMPKNGLNVSFA